MLEDKYLGLSLGFAKWLACKFDTLQLAILASFFSSLAANLGIIIQTRNFCELQRAEEQQQLDEKTAALLQAAAGDVGLPFVRR